MNVKQKDFHKIPKHPGGRPKEPESLRSLGRVTIGVDAKTRKRIKILAGSMPLSLWLRRTVAKHYTKYVMDLAEEFEILGFEDEEPILGEALHSEPDNEPEDDKNEPCDLTDIDNWKKDYKRD